jgi:AraC-like DNA-binding protein
MPNLETPRTVITLVATSQSEMLEKVKHWLKLQNYGIHGLRSWESPNDLCDRMGISPSTLQRRLKSSSCPEADIERGPSGRLIRLRSNPSLEEFLQTSKANQNETSNPQK